MVGVLLGMGSDCRTVSGRKRNAQWALAKDVCKSILGDVMPCGGEKTRNIRALVTYLEPDGLVATTPSEAKRLVNVPPSGQIHSCGNSK